MELRANASAGSSLKPNVSLLEAPRGALKATKRFRVPLEEPCALHLVASLTRSREEFIYLKFNDLASHHRSIPPHCILLHDIY